MLRCFERIRLFEGLSCLARAKTRLQPSFCGEVFFFFFFFFFLSFLFFFFSASFTYLQLLYLLYFSSAVFLSACLIFRYRSAVCLMRFMQLIHFILQPSVSSLSLDLQCSTVRHRSSHFTSSDTNFFELRLLVSVVF